MESHTKNCRYGFALTEQECKSDDVVNFMRSAGSSNSFFTESAFRFGETGSWGNFNSGCFVSNNGGIFFNTNSQGINSSSQYIYYRSVCKGGGE